MSQIRAWDLPSHSTRALPLQLSGPRSPLTAPAQALPDLHVGIHADISDVISEYGCSNASEYNADEYDQRILAHWDATAGSAVCLAVTGGPVPVSNQFDALSALAAGSTT